MAEKLEGSRLARVVWARYLYLRDNGHQEYIEKAARCEAFFEGLQWDAADLARLKAQRRPALTINKIISTLSNVMGAQIFNRTDTAFKPRNEDATAEVADALTKVYMQISDNNDLTWVRSDVFADGAITSRGFYDVRLDFNDSLRGEVRIKQLNPKNVLIDVDADSYDPAGWSDVMYTEWMTLDDIELLYSKKAADKLRAQSNTALDTAGDAQAYDRDRFGGKTLAPAYAGGTDVLADQVQRTVRVIDYQWRKLDTAKHFVHNATGDMRPIPDSWDDARIAEYIQQNPQTSVIKRLVKRVRWTVVAGDVVLHDDWSPYTDFTIVPYFPHFRRGRTIGIAENLLGSQELLNKTSSQELHVVNTTANSGYYVKRNALSNMSVAELEERGAQSGIVIEVEDLGMIQKIAPNPTPTGLDRISYKAEEHIKSISGVSDYMTGFAREDVSAKSVKANQAGGSANLAAVQDSLNRTDYMLARRVLSIVQNYYTEERLVLITSDRMMNTTDKIQVNQQTPEGKIINDLTLGEYSVVVTNQPDRDTFEETQYDQVMRLKEAGVPVPPKFLVQSSRLRDKADIIRAIEGDSESPEAQERAALEKRMHEAEVADKEADVMLKQAKAKAELAKADAPPDQAGANGMTPELQLKQDELALERYKLDKELELKKYEVDKKMEMEKYKTDMQYKMAEEAHERSEAPKKLEAAKQNIAALAESMYQEDAAPETEPTPTPTPTKEDVAHDND